MKLTIRGQDPTIEKEPELEFYLSQNSNDEITLRVTNEEGKDGWHILTIMPDGQIQLHSYLSPLGFFDLDEEDRRIKIKENAS